MILYEARCAAKVVTIIDNGIPTVVPDCNILGTGMAPQSSGIVIADEDRFWYIPLVTGNITSIVDELISITDNLKETLTTLESAKTLIDSSSTAAGIAAFVPSVVTGTQMATEATATKTKVEKIATELKVLKENIV